MAYPALKFTDRHLWVRVKGSRIVVGVTDFRQQDLGDIHHVELPEPDEHHYEADEEVGVIEAANNTADFSAPVSGVICAVNAELVSDPDLIHTDPYGAGWLFEMKPDDMDDLGDLMDVHEYEAWTSEDEAE